MRIRFKSGPVFQSADLQESSEALHNPGCGWYHVYTFAAQPPADGRPVEEEVWLDEDCRQEQLALVLIDIGAFRTGALSEEALRHIGQIMAFFSGHGMQMILRFVYDNEGKGMQREPLALATVKEHMRQVGGLVCAWRKDILVLQGIFVGNWGEMHGSKFLDDISLRELVNTLYEATEGSCFLAVRTPSQWRRIMAGRRTAAGLDERLGLFNDGIFGSPTDLGTYGSQSRKEAGETGSWSRAEELEWQDARLGMTPNGGEALSAAPLTGYRQAAEELALMHLCYLNGIYHQEQLEYWKKERVEEQGCWKGKSGYDYIGGRLGCRFVVRSAEEKKGKLRIEVENCGFGNLLEEAECFLITEDGEGRTGRKLLDTDARGWKSGENSWLYADLPDLEGTVGRLFLALKRKRDGRPIRFANRGAGDSVLLGEIGNR